MFVSRLDPYLLLVILFSLFTIGPLLQPGYLWDAHDARHSVYFLFEFDQGIQDGILYPRWQPDFAFGYGYPFFNIYGPLSTYVGEAFHLLGLGFTDAVKIVFALSVVGSGWPCTALSNRSWAGGPAWWPPWPTWSSPTAWWTSTSAPPWPSRWPTSLCPWCCGACGPRSTARAWPTSWAWPLPTPR